MSLLDAVRRDGLASERRPMPILAFIRENARWIAGGFLLTLFSAAGQTYFISLSAGDIRAEYGLSHGQFGLLYMIATLASALTLTRLGQIVDWLKVGRVTLVIVPALAAASVAMRCNSTSSADAFSNALRHTGSSSPSTARGVLAMVSCMRSAAWLR